VALADIEAVTAAVAARGDFEENLGPLVDQDDLVTYMAADVWMGNYDGYVNNMNNYWSARSLSSKHALRPTRARSSRARRSPPPRARSRRGSDRGVTASRVSAGSDSGIASLP
jgi:hypothetical protein